MRKVIAISRRLTKAPSGATSIEYGLIGALISLALIGGATIGGQAIQALYGIVGAQIAAVAAGIGA